MNAATTGDHWSRCRHHLLSPLPLSLSLICFPSWRWEWMINDRAGFSIKDGGWQVSKTTERNGSASNAGCIAGYNITHWVYLRGSSGWWCTQRGSWSIYWPSLCSRWGESHLLSVISNVIILQQRWGGGVLTLDCSGNRTPALIGIPFASQYRNASLDRRMLWIPPRPMHLLSVTFTKTSNISYNQRCFTVKMLVSCCLIWMFDIKTVETISTACIYKGRQGRHLCEQPGSDCTKKRAAV
jgi:hypothetical protein